jgi:glycosyltransferase involved in cell wall biosynthesis
VAGQRICIVTAGSLSSGPRVEKEAQTLVQAGYDVQVVACHRVPWLQAWDEQIAREHGIAFRAVALHTGNPLARTQRIAAVLLHRSAAAFCARTGTLPVAADLALSEQTAPLLAAALSRRAQLYVAHNLAALPVAAALAALHRARFAFDSEDDHVGELPDDAPQPRRALIEHAHARYLPRCAYVSVPSDGIADLLAQRYGIARPHVLLNVFPWSLRDGLDGQRRDRQGTAPSLYWYSQSVGLDRGLQDLLRAAGLLRGEFELHLRGHASPVVRETLLAIAREGGVAERVFFHEQVHPHELLSRSAEHDIGLALEQPVTRNHRLTVSNKMFFYLLAGLAVAATETTGQAAIMQQLSGAGFSYSPGDHAGLARGLQRWLDDRLELQRARAAALDAARTRFCWELERETLLAAVRSALLSC